MRSLLICAARLSNTLIHYSSAHKRIRCRQGQGNRVDCIQRQGWAPWIIPELIEAGADVYSIAAQKYATSSPFDAGEKPRFLAWTWVFHRYVRRCPDFYCRNSRGNNTALIASCLWGSWFPREFDFFVYTRTLQGGSDLKEVRSIDAGWSQNWVAGASWPRGYAFGHCITIPSKLLVHAAN